MKFFRYLIMGHPGRRKRTRRDHKVYFILPTQMGTFRGTLHLSNDERDSLITLIGKRGSISYPKKK